jgi:hypothetical protein
LAQEAQERDPVLRAAWFRKLANWRGEQLVFLDESGVNWKLTQPTHGWGPKGERTRIKVHTRRAVNLSLLPALTLDGYIACNVYEGGVTTDRYMEFIEHDLLPKCGRYPGPKSVIVMDNCKIHRDPVLLYYDDNLF